MTDSASSRCPLPGQSQTGDVGTLQEADIDRVRAGGKLDGAIVPAKGMGGVIGDNQLLVDPEEGPILTAQVEAPGAAVRDLDGADEAHAEVVVRASVVEGTGCPPPVDVGRYLRQVIVLPIDLADGQGMREVVRPVRAQAVVASAHRGRVGGRQRLGGNDGVVGVRRSLPR